MLRFRTSLVLIVLLSCALAQTAPAESKGSGFFFFLSCLFFVLFFCFFFAIFFPFRKRVRRCFFILFIVKHAGCSSGTKYRAPATSFKNIRKNLFMKRYLISLQTEAPGRPKSLKRLLQNQKSSRNSLKTRVDQGRSQILPLTRKR